MAHILTLTGMACTQALFRYACVGMLVLFPYEQVLARWNHHNATTLNKVAGLSSEYYNDILSYRDPNFWEESWETSTLGFRSSAGSLNQKDFLFQQSIRITSSVQDAWQLAYTSDRDEEPRRVLENSALELSYGSEQNRWRLGLLGDAQTEKAFMDLGMRLSFAPEEGSLWQLIAWSVDTFYTEKKHLREDYRTRNPWSWELLFLQSWGQSTVRLQHQQDQPVVWYQVSKDQRYAYRHQATELRWTYEMSETQDVFLQLEHDQESEAIAALSVIESQGYESRRSLVELGQRLNIGRESFTSSLWGLWDQMQLDQANAETTLDRAWIREELALLGVWSRPFWNGIHDQHSGLLLNLVQRDEDKEELIIEGKLIWGPDFVLGKYGRMRLTTTWDVDQLIHDFPYTRRSFQPWGGGQASFLMVF